MSNPIVPIMNPQRLFSVWQLNNIYTGPNGTGAYVPNNGDLVVDLSTGFWQVTDVDYTTGLSVLAPWVPPNQANGVIPQDVLLGAGPGTQSESYRCYIDTSVTPNTLALDSRLHVYSANASYVKVFIGTDISAAGTVISAQVDQNNNVTTENLSLSLVQDPTNSTLAVKAVDPGVSVEALSTGTVVTAVVYAANGTVLSLSKLLVSQTNFIRTTNASQKYVTGIQLVSPYISASNSQLINIPINMLVQATAMQGKVLYSDGTSIILPIDGTRFVLAGLNGFIASVVGQQVPLVLIYNFASNEYGYSVSGEYPSRFMTADYSITTTEVLGAYSAKIYAVPRWNLSTSTYALSYYLYNLDRNAVYDVTPYVNLVAPNGTFSPQSFSTIQTLSLQMNLNSLGSSFAYYMQNQIINVSLLSPGSSNSANWWVQYTPSGPQYGGAIAANVTNVLGNSWNVDLSLGMVDVNTWLTSVYYNAQPIFDPATEVQAPIPTHVRILIGAGFTQIIPIANFSQVLSGITLNSPAPAQGDVVLLQFLVENGSTIQEVGLGYLPIHIV